MAIGDNIPSIFSGLPQSVLKSGGDPQYLVDMLEGRDPDREMALRDEISMGMGAPMPMDGPLIDQYLQVSGGDPNLATSMVIDDVSSRGVDIDARLEQAKVDTAAQQLYGRYPGTIARSLVNDVSKEMDVSSDAMVNAYNDISAEEVLNRITSTGIEGEALFNPLPPSPQTKGGAFPFGFGGELTGTEGMFAPSTSPRLDMSDPFKEPVFTDTPDDVPNMPPTWNNKPYDMTEEEWDNAWLDYYIAGGEDPTSYLDRLLEDIRPWYKGPIGDKLPPKNPGYQSKILNERRIELGIPTVPPEPTIKSFDPIITAKAFREPLKVPSTSYEAVEAKEDDSQFELGILGNPNIVSDVSRDTGFVPVGDPGFYVPVGEPGFQSMRGVTPPLPSTGLGTELTIGVGDREFPPGFGEYSLPDQYASYMQPLVSNWGSPNIESFYNRQLRALQGYYWLQPRSSETYPQTPTSLGATDQQWGKFLSNIEAEKLPVLNWEQFDSQWDSLLDYSDLKQSNDVDKLGEWTANNPILSGHINKNQKKDLLSLAVARYYKGQPVQAGYADSALWSSLSNIYDDLQLKAMREEGTTGNVPAHFLNFISKNNPDRFGR